MNNLGYLEEKIIKGKSLGLSDDELDNWKSKKIQQLKNKGYSNEEIQESLGVYRTEKIYQDKEVVEPINKYWNEKLSTKIKRKAKGLKTWAVGEESDIYDFLKQGFGESGTNFFLQYHTDGKYGYDWTKAYRQLGDDGAIERLARSIGTLIGDAPVGVATGAPTFLATRNLVATGAVSGFATEAVKKTYYESLKSGKVRNFPQWWQMFADKGIYEGIKGGAMFAGTLAGPAALTKLGMPSNVLSTLLGTYTGMTTMGIAINSLENGKETGQYKLILPSKQELVDNALFISTLTGGAIGITKGYNMILNRMSKTGESATDVTEDIVRDAESYNEATSRNKTVFSKTITPKGEERKKNLEKQLEELRNISNKKETKSEEILKKDLLELEKKKLTTKEEEESASIIEEMDFIKAKLDEFEYRKKPENKGILSKSQEILEKEFKELGGSIKPNETIVGEVEPRSSDSAMNSMKDQIQFGEVKQRRSTEQENFTYSQKAVQSVFDEGYHIKTIEDQMVKEGVKRKFVYEGYTNLSGLAGHASSWISELGRGTFNMDGQIDGPSMMQILKPLQATKDRKSRFEDASAYMVSKRVVELEGRGKDTNMPLEDAKVVSSKYKDDPDFKNVEKNFKSIQDKKRHFMKDSGLISEPLFNAMTELNKDYVPFQKIYDPGLKGDVKLGRLRIKEIKGLGKLKEKIQKEDEKMQKAQEELSEAIGKGPDAEAAAEVKIDKIGNKVLKLKEELEAKTKVIDPFEVEMRDITRTISLAETNKVKADFIKMRKELEVKNPDSLLVEMIQRVKPSIEEIKVSRKQLEKMLPEEYQNIVNKLSDDDIDALSIFKPREERLKDTYIEVNINGKREVWDVGDKYLAQALQRNKQFNKLLKFFDEKESPIISKLLKVPELYTKISRYGVTTDLAFALGTSVGQEMVLPMITNIGYKPGFDLLKGMAWQTGMKDPSKLGFKDPFSVKKLKGIFSKEGVERAKKMQSEFERLLGNSTYLETIKDSFTSGQIHKSMQKRKFIHEIIPTDPMSPMLVPYEIFKNIAKKGTPIVGRYALKGLQLPISVTEKAARLVIYDKKKKQLLKENETLPESLKLSLKDIETLAKFEARDIQDFGRYGSQMEAATRINHFLNAGYQSVWKIMRTTANAKTRKRMLKIGFWGMTVPTMMLWYANKDSYTYHNVVKPWERDNYWIFVTNEEKREYYTQKKPWELGWIFATLPEKILDSFFKTDEDYINQVETFWLLDGIKYMLNFIPTADILTNYFEDITNRNSYTGKPTRPRRFGERELAEFEVTRGTSETAKILGKTIRAIGGVMQVPGKDYGSPHMIDHYIKGWLGPTGENAIKLLDNVIIKLGGNSKEYIKPWNKENSSNLSRMPVIDHYFKRATLGASALEKYWQNYEKVLPYIGIRDRIIKRGNYTNEDEKKIRRDMLKVMSDYEYRAVSIIQRSQKTLSRQYNVIRLLNSKEVKSDFTPDEIAERIDEVLFQMINIANNANTQVYKIKKANE